MVKDFALLLIKDAFNPEEAKHRILEEQQKMSTHAKTKLQAHNYKSTQAIV